MASGLSCLVALCWLCQGVSVRLPCSSLRRAVRTLCRTEKWPCVSTGPVALVCPARWHACDYLAARKTLARQARAWKSPQALGAARDAADSTNSKAYTSSMEAAPMRMQEEPVAETSVPGSHFWPEEPEHEEEEPQPGPQRAATPNTFSGPKLRWPAIREAFGETRQRRPGPGRAVVRGYAAAWTRSKVAEVLSRSVAARVDVDAAPQAGRPGGYQRLWPCRPRSDENGRLVVCERREHGRPPTPGRLSR